MARTYSATICQAVAAFPNEHIDDDLDQPATRAL